MQEQKGNFMAYYIGLTDDPAIRRQEHGNPADWQQTTPFSSEQIARDWEKREIAKPGCRGGPGGKGWRFGYWYTISPDTIE